MNKQDLIHEAKLETDLKLLQESVAHWKMVVAGLEEGRGSQCPLCIKYVPQSCSGCPIYLNTGFDGCCGTPYYAWRDHVETHDNYCRGVYRGFYIQAGCSECQMLALQELSFLQDLLILALER